MVIWPPLPGCRSAENPSGSASGLNGGSAGHVEAAVGAVDDVVASGIVSVVELEFEVEVEVELGAEGSDTAVDDA